MKIIGVYKAQPTIGKVEAMAIEIIEEAPTHASLEEAENFYQRQAKILCNALLAVLPQGTSDRLLAELLKRKASLFVFPQEDGKEK